MISEVDGYKIMMKSKLSAKLRDIRYPEGKKALVHFFPIKGGYVQITNDWFILNEWAAGPKESREKEFKSLCRKLIWAAGSAFAGIIIWIDILYKSFGKGWWAILIIFSFTLFASHRNTLYGMLGGHFVNYIGQGNVRIALSNIKKTTLLNEMFFLRPSLIVVHYEGKKGHNKRLKIIVEGSFLNTKSQAAEAARILKTMNCKKLRLYGKL